MKSWLISVRGFPKTVKEFETRGKAHAWAFKSLREAGYNIPWGEIRVRRNWEAKPKE